VVSENWLTKIGYSGTGKYRRHAIETSEVHRISTAQPTNLMPLDGALRAMNGTRTKITKERRFLKISRFEQISEERYSARLSEYSMATDAVQHAFSPIKNICHIIESV
jgi:hypothetical protein